MEKHHQSNEKVSFETHQDVLKMTFKLRREGYDIELVETLDEYVVHHGGKEYHFTKLEQFPLSDGKEVHWLPLAVAMEKQLRKEIPLEE